MDGTSYAVPLVSGAAGLLFSFDPTLTATQVKQLLIQGAIKGGRTAATGSPVVASYPFLDVYESLKLAAETPGRPLCGNHVWIENRQVVAERGTTTEVLAQLDSSWYGAYLNLKHGGHRFEVDYSYAFVHDDYTHLWTQISGGRDANALDGGMFSSYNAASHDQDVWANAYTVSDTTNHVRRVHVLVTDSAGQRELKTLVFPHYPAAVKCGLKLPSSMSETLDEYGNVTSRHFHEPYECVDSTFYGVPTGTWQEIAGQNNNPILTAKGDKLLIPIDYWTGGESDAGVFSPCLGTPHDDDGNPYELCLEATITRNLVKTDILQIPLQGTIPSNVEANPVWTIANRGIYWLASSEDDKEFAGGFETMSSVVQLNTTIQPYAPFNCTNEYRASFADSQPFGTLIGTAVVSGAPNDAYSCWVDGGSGISPIKVSGAQFNASVSTGASAITRSPMSISQNTSRIILRNRSRPVIGRSRKAVPFSKAYSFPGGLWFTNSRGQLVLERKSKDLLPTRREIKSGRGQGTRGVGFKRTRAGWTMVPSSN